MTYLGRNALWLGGALVICLFFGPLIGLYAFGLRNWLIAENKTQGMLFFPTPYESKCEFAVYMGTAKAGHLVGDCKLPQNQSMDLCQSLRSPSAFRLASPDCHDTDLNGVICLALAIIWTFGIIGSLCETIRCWDMPHHVSHSEELIHKACVV